MESIPNNEDCIKLDHRFDTRVMPDPERAAALEQQDLCASIIAGERCYFRLSKAGAPDSQVCQRTASDAKAFGEFITDTLFRSITEPLKDKSDPQENE